jgi:hypothetical protein
VTSAIPRALAALVAMMQVGGGLAHASAFSGAAAIVEGVPLPPFILGSFKTLWLIDSTLQVVLGLIAAALAWRPGLASGVLLVALGLIPLGSALLLYRFLPGFYAGHLMVMSAAGLITAGIFWPPRAAA